MTARELIAAIERAAAESPKGLDEEVLLDIDEGVRVLEIARVDFDATGAERPAIFVADTDGGWT